MSQDIYFAADDVTELVGRIERDNNKWSMASAGSNVFAAVMAAYWRNTTAFYQSIIEPDSWTSSLGFRGKQGELVKITVPEARTLTNQFCTLVTKPKKYYECVVDVNQSNAIQSARIGKAICNAEVQNFSFDSLLYACAQRVAVQGMHFASCTWQSDKGYIYSQSPEGNPVYSGKAWIERHDLSEVIFNWSIPDARKWPWVVIKRRKLRWDLISQYPELKQQILSAPSITQERMATPNFSYTQQDDDNDHVYVREFYHVPSPAIPSGRMVAFLSDDCVFYDGENPYECLPIVPFTFEKIHDTSLGFPMFSDLMPCQEMIDNVMSSWSTNISSMGVQSVLVPKGSDIGLTDVREGMNFITYTPQNADGGGKPEPLMLAVPPPGAGEILQILSSKLTNLSGINEVLRGQTSANVTSGAMAATLSANALEFLNHAQSEMTEGARQLMDLLIKCYRLFASVEQIIDVVGDDKQAYAQEFKMEDLQSIKKVHVKEQSPMMSSVAGRLQLAEAVLPMLQQGQPAAVGKYLAIIEGAPVESLFNDEFDLQQCIQREIDSLMQGENIMPVITDNHPEYIKAYQRVLSNPFIRTRSELVQHVIEVMQTRIQLELQFQQMPELYQMLRGQPPPQMQAPMQPGQGQAPSQIMAAQPQNEMAAPAQPAEPVA